MVEWVCVCVWVQVRMATNLKCQLLCQSDKQFHTAKLTQEQAGNFIDKIKHNYYVHL